MAATTNLVPKNQLLRRLPPADFARLRPLLKRVELPFGKVISEAGSPVDGVIFLEEGIVSLIVILSNGDSIEVALVGAEGAVGMPALFEVKRSAHRVVVQGAGYGYRLSNGGLKRAMQNDGMLSRLLLQSAYRTSLVMAQTAACNRLHEAEERLARWLLLMDDRNRSGLLTLTHEFLSAMLGTRRSTVTIASGVLQKAGLIEHHRGTIRVIDRAGLEAVACECYALMRDGNGNGTRARTSPTRDGNGNGTRARTSPPRG